MDARSDTLSVTVVGAGPRGTGVLERLLANVDELLPARRLHIDLVDPYPAGAGRVWRADQSPLMLMNVASRNVTMFTDETVLCTGPIRPGPALDEWARTAPGHPDVAAGSAFANRATQGEYLSAVLAKVIAERPGMITVTVHEAAAIGLTRTADGRQHVWLADRDEPLTTDVVVLTLGHLDAVPSKAEGLLADFADRHDLNYIPPCYTADVDLSMLRAGEKVAVRGFGLAFIDLMVLLTEGRGGRFETGADNRLTYHPSGQEPVLYVGSRRGVPYRAKIDYALAGPPAPLPRFFSADIVERRFADRQKLGFHTDLWPLIAKEIGWGYYHELFNGHPDRVRTGWDQFAERYAELDWDSPAMRDLIVCEVPNTEDRLDFDALDRPLEGEWSYSLDELHDTVRGHVRADVARMGDPRFSAELGAYLAMLSVHAELPAIVAAGKLTTRAYIEDMRGWWFRFFEYASSGPPIGRVHQLLALADAGIVRFLGHDIRVVPDEQESCFWVGGAGTRQAVATTALVDARLPSPTLHTTTDALLRGLYEDGEAREEVLRDDHGYTHRSGLLQVSEVDFRILDRAGTPQPDRFALGPYTSIRHFASFARPRSNANPFRQNDVLARAALAHLAGRPPATTDTTRCPVRPPAVTAANGARVASRAHVANGARVASRARVASSIRPDLGPHRTANDD
jgi:uncharacterized NAD(P)/FAD-binding protein YdhS